jgi:TIR domain
LTRFAELLRTVLSAGHWGVAKGGTMAKIFISYRRNDSAYIAATIYTKIQGHFGCDSVFFDIDNIPFGVDLRKHIENAVGQCGVLLVVIGDHWIRQSDGRGHRHLDDPVDYVRIEVESAF